MTRFTTGVLAGSVMAVMGISYLVNDKKARNKVVKTSRRMAAKAGHVLDDMTDSMEDMF